MSQSIEKGQKKVYCMGEKKAKDILFMMIKIQIVTYI